MMNATNNTATTVKTADDRMLEALYADLCEAEHRIDLLAKLLTEANDNAVAIEARITALEEKMAEEKAKKNEPTTAEQTAETPRKPKNNKTKSKKTSKKTNKKPTAELQTAKTETAKAEERKTEQRRAAYAKARDNKAKYAKWEKEAAKKVAVYDRPNHQTAWLFYDENGDLLGRKPVH